MITEIKIENFKSIASLTFKPGRVTVLIGENGSGKSNILEAIAFGAGAASNKLDREFLYSRGVRVTESNLMQSAFADNEAISFSFDHLSGQPGLEFSVQAIYRDDGSFENWLTTTPSKEGGWQIVLPKVFADSLSSLEKDTSSLDVRFFDEPKLRKLEELRRELKILASFRDASLGTILTAEQSGLCNFLIYAPENTVLRAFDPEGAIEPLGCKGEGLLKLLQSFGDDQYQDRFGELKESLHTLGWFGDLALPDTGDAFRDRIRITDALLPPDRSTFDQRSANEGFLLLLFYFVLFLSWRTPKFFAIDNIDTALNPKLCATLMRQLAALAAKYDKQVIFTTHNPAILDGLDLNDDEQRLFTVSRNDDGHTQVRRVAAPQPRPGERPIKLSEAFLRGLIGGLPNNF